MILFACILLPMIGKLKKPTVGKLIRKLLYYMIGRHTD